MIVETILQGDYECDLEAAVDAGLSNVAASYFAIVESSAFPATFDVAEDGRAKLIGIGGDLVVSSGLPAYRNAISSLIHFLILLGDHVGDHTSVQIDSDGGCILRIGCSHTEHLNVFSLADVMKATSDREVT